jgi:hypothetical protein
MPFGPENFECNKYLIKLGGTAVFGLEEFGVAKNCDEYDFWYRERSDDVWRG